MAPRRSRPRRFLLPVLIAAVLAAEITGLAIARSLTTVAAPAAVPAAPGAASSAALVDRESTSNTRSSVADTSRDAVSVAATQARVRSALIVSAPPRVLPASPARATKTGAAVAKATAAPSATYRGRNHVWIPSLGINRSVSAFPCSRTRPPDNLMYRWGCAGANNVYLLGHAHSVFKPLHDAYVGGRLKKGMKVISADGSGRVGTYSVIWWKVVAPTTAASWAWAPQSKPSMTLQTCVGSKSQYRLMVRLVKVG